MDYAFDALKDYKPEPVKDTFEIIKGNYNACFNFMRIEDYTGNNADYTGHQFVRYELMIVDDPVHSGRRLWRRYNLMNPDQVKRLADMLFTLKIEFKDMDSLTEAIVKAQEVRVKVRCWGWTPEGEEEARQQHIIRGIAKEESTEKVAF
jgi:hypothetical protein